MVSKGEISKEEFEHHAALQRDYDVTLTLLVPSTEIKTNPELVPRYIKQALLPLGEHIRTSYDACFPRAMGTDNMLDLSRIIYHKVADNPVQ